MKTFEKELSGATKRDKRFLKAGRAARRYIKSSARIKKSNIAFA